MHEKKVTPLSIAALIGAVVLFWLFFQGMTEDREVDTGITNFEECVEAGNLVMESYPRQCRVGDTTFIEDIGNELEKRDLIRISYPRPNQMITSPLTIEGEARGTWFFEGDFPIELQDESGEVIVRHYATAQGEWMTENFVPFKATIEFDSTPQKGTLVLLKDNPSGLPEHADELVVPLTILESNTPTVTETGMLSGVVTIGPVCPVEREGVPCDIPPEVYTSRSIIVHSEDGKTEVTRRNFNVDGTYEFSLEPGSYIIDIAKTGIDSSSDLPKEILIKSGEVLELNFDIDTGIR